MKWLGEIIAFVLWWVKRRLTKADAPQQRYETAREENARITETGDADAANAKLDRNLGRVSNATNKGRGDSR